MDDQEVYRRLVLIREIVTPAQEVPNRIVVEEHGVTVRSSRTENDRTIPFSDILNGSTRHGCIINSLRQILGLGQAD
jgi:hypothetical protein